MYLKMPINNSSQVSKMRAKLKGLTLKTNKKTNSSFIYNTAVSFFK